MIHQLLAGRDFCESSWMAPIQSVVFQFASQMKNFVYFICNTETMQCVVVDAVIIYELMISVGTLKALLVMQKETE
jgi:hypothetical protein